MHWSTVNKVPIHWLDEIVGKSYFIAFLASTSWDCKSFPSIHLVHSAISSLWDNFITSSPNRQTVTADHCFAYNLMDISIMIWKLYFRFSLFLASFCGLLFRHPSIHWPSLSSWNIWNWRKTGICWSMQTVWCREILWRFWLRNCYCRLWSRWEERFTYWH